MFFSLKKQKQSSRKRLNSERDEPRDLRLVGLVNEARTEEERLRISAGH